MAPYAVYIIHDTESLSPAVLMQTIHKVEWLSIGSSFLYQSVQYGQTGFFLLDIPHTHTHTVFFCFGGLYCKNTKKIQHDIFTLPSPTRLSYRRILDF